LINVHGQRLTQSIVPALILAVPGMVYVVNVCTIIGSAGSFLPVILLRKKKKHTIEAWNFIFNVILKSKKPGR
jgi:hypothetical protein